MASTSTTHVILENEEYPNWLEMPEELMINILQRLRSAEILNNTRKVCTTWRRICNDPVMWKVIDMQNWFDDWEGNYDLERLTKQAVNLSCGELIDISLNYFGSDDLLLYIVLHSSKLKRLSLWCCYDITGNGLSHAIKTAPQLQELDLGYTSIESQDIEVIGQNCPHLKSFKIDMMVNGHFDNHALAIANTMPMLRRLHIYGGDMTNTGFQAILNRCLYLESLHIHMCYSLNLDGDLVKECMERVKNFQHNSTQTYADSDRSSSVSVSVSDVDDDSDDDSDYYDFV